MVHLDNYLYGYVPSNSENLISYLWDYFNTILKPLQTSLDIQLKVTKMTAIFRFLQHTKTASDVLAENVVTLYLQNAQSNETLHEIIKK